MTPEARGPRGEPGVAPQPGADRLPDGFVVACQQCGADLRWHPAGLAGLFVDSGHSCAAPAPAPAVTDPYADPYCPACGHPRVAPTGVDPREALERLLAEMDGALLGDTADEEIAGALAPKWADRIREMVRCRICTRVGCQSEAHAANVAAAPRVSPPPPASESAGADGARPEGRPESGVAERVREIENELSGRPTWSIETYREALADLLAQRPRAGAPGGEVRDLAKFVHDGLEEAWKGDVDINTVLAATDKRCVDLLTAPAPVAPGPCVCCAASGCQDPATCACSTAPVEPCEQCGRPEPECRCWRSEVGHWLARPAPVAPPP